MKALLILIGIMLVAVALMVAAVKVIVKFFDRN